MTDRNTLKKIHFYCTALLIAAVIYIVTFELILASKSWWVIISISGYSTFIVVFMTSLYLFVISRGVSRIEKNPQEHPLTTSLSYLFFYDCTPTIGIFAGIIAAWGTKSAGNFLFITAAGIFWTTAMVWMIVDPAIGLAEILSPSVMAHRKQRLLQAKLLKQQQGKLRKQLLNEVQLQEQKQIDQHYLSLKPLAEKLIFLFSSDQNAFSIEAVDIGVKAWQLGGINCMKQLYSMVIEMYKEQASNVPPIDHIASCWDGIGNWRTDYLKNII